MVCQPSLPHHRKTRHFEHLGRAKLSRTDSELDHLLEQRTETKQYHRKLEPIVITANGDNTMLLMFLIESHFHTARWSVSQRIRADSWSD